MAVMQLVPGWEKKGAGKAFDMNSLIEPLFLYHCVDFLNKNIELAKKNDYLTPEFLAKVYGILKLLKPMFDALGVRGSSFDELIGQGEKREWQ